MPNLIDSFGGKRRFYEKFNSSMFKDAEGDTLLVAPNLDEGQGGIACHRVNLLSSGRVGMQMGSKFVPHDYFQDMSTFATPELGWRATAAGKVLVYYRKSDSTYQRGTSVRVLATTTSRFTEWLSLNGEIDIAREKVASKIAHSIMNPVYHTLATGLAAIREGRLGSFAINANIAVTPSETGEFDMWYRTSRVGTVTAGGDVSTNNAYVLSSTQESN